MLRIGNLTLPNWLIMAPMAGYTNLAFRLMVRRLGAGLVTTEMVSAMGLARDQKRTMAYLRSHPEEKPLSVQLFGSRPEVMAKAARMAVEAGADLVDINAGCPVKKVVKTGAGASLLREPKRLAEIVCAVRLAVSVPVTVKIRSGWSPQEPAACEVARILEDCGADGITVHGRFATDGFSGPADWSWIGRVKERSRIPVIGNGDVLEPAAAFRMKAETGCDGVMIGRAAIGNPWIFRQVLHAEQGLPVQAPQLSERRSHILEHFRLLSDCMGEHRAALNMRGVMLSYTKGLPRSSAFRGLITRVRDTDSLVRTMDNYFSSLEAPGS
ncbi:MAG: tRNA dihydrouridine synthase DusB [Thermodesulfobacteriota bacterium]